MNHLSNEALAHLINALRPMADMAEYYKYNGQNHVVHQVSFAHPPYVFLLTVADLRRAKDIVDAYDEAQQAKMSSSA